MPARGVKEPVRFIDESEESFDGGSITEALFNYIRSVLPDGKTILELGSGWGTGQLAKYYTMYSVEHDEKYLDKYDTTYFYVPLKEHKPLHNHKATLWYDPKILRDMLDGLKYDLLLIDGPPHTRSGFFKYFDLFDETTILVFDDVIRGIDRKVINSISSKLKCPYTVYGNGEGKPFGVINDPNTK
jgi:hypothetical protein